MASWALGAFLAALAGRAHHPDPGLDDERHGADAAGHRRLRGRDVRSAAQRAPDVRRRPRARPRGQLRHRVLPGRRVDVGRQLPGVAADDRPVRRAAVPAAGPPARRHRAAHPRALPHAQHAQRAHRGRGPGRRHVPGARPAGADLDQHARLRDDRCRSSPCRSCCSPATRARSTWPCCRSGRSGRSSSTTSGSAATGRVPGRRCSGTCWRPSCARWSGPSWRCPSLRLRGLYLALSTMAFGVFVSNMILREIVERKLPLIHTRFSIFPSGNLGVPRPKFGPVDLVSMPSFLMFVTVLFAVLGVGLVALRHSGYGRRLTAMKDSPAASATLGQIMVTLKLSVFMLSAAIAGVGGALMTAQIGSANLDRFDIFLSLSLLMLTRRGGHRVRERGADGRAAVRRALRGPAGDVRQARRRPPRLRGHLRLPGPADDRAARAARRQHRPEPHGCGRAHPHRLRRRSSGPGPRWSAPSPSWRWPTSSPATRRSATGGSSSSPASCSWRSTWSPSA